MVKNTRIRAILNNRLTSPNSAISDDIFKFLVSHTVPRLQDHTYQIFKVALEHGNFDKSLDIIIDNFPSEKQDLLEEFLANKIAASVKR